MAYELRQLVNGIFVRRALTSSLLEAASSLDLWVDQRIGGEVVPRRLTPALLDAAESGEAHVLVTEIESGIAVERRMTPEVLEEVGFSGGGGAPEWVPENAKIHIDFVNDRAWTEEDGEIAIDTLLGSDANTENYWDTTSYDPETMLSAEGLNSEGSSSAFIGVARSALVAGATTRFVIKQLQTSEEIKKPLMLMAADGNNGAHVALNAGSADLTLGGEGVSSGGITANVGVNAVNAVAVTFTSDRAEWAVNGSAASTATVDANYWPDENPFVAALVNPGGGFAMRELTIYDPLPDTDGLSELSEV
jgi:hypothetical protein